MMLHKKQTLIIAVIVLVVVAVGLVVIKASQKKDMSDQQSQSQEDQKANPALLGETYTNEQAKVSFRLPKGWVQVEKPADNPYALVKFQNPQVEEGAAGHANGQLSVRPATISLEDYTRDILEASLNLSVHSKLLHNEDVLIGNQPARWISHEIPGPNGTNGTITQYIFIKNDKYYVLSFTALSATLDNFQKTIDASVRSLKIQ